MNTEPNLMRRRLLQATALSAAGVPWLAGCAGAGAGTGAGAGAVAGAGAGAVADIGSALPALSHDALLADLERRSFRYFWDLAHPHTGLVPDRWPTPSFCSVAAVGFGLSALVIGAQRGWVSRAQAGRRARLTLNTLVHAPQGPQAQGVAGHKGFFYHFLHMESGLRFADCELSTVDTALLLAGALHAREYFNAADALEADIRQLADTLYARVQWPWAQVRPPAISHGWRPESGFIGNDWKGYNEAMLVYFLALGSPTHAVEPQAWDAWVSTYARDSWGSEFGETYLRFAPLFGHQFTHAWVDFRGLADAFLRQRGLDYFENSVRATRAQRAYAIANPEGWAGYGPDAWGVTACDGPADLAREFGGRLRRFSSYAGRGMGGARHHDDGTLAPYGAGSSLPFAPEACTRALAYMRQRWGAHIYGRYGYFAFNPSFTFTDVKLKHGRVMPGVGWVDSDFLGIEVGPQLLMLANHRDGGVWNTMRSAPWLRLGLKRAGFAGGWLG